MVEGLRGYRPSLKRFGFWFSEEIVGGVGFGIDVGFFFSLNRLWGRIFCVGGIDGYYPFSITLVFW